jgi:hypothetical protein
MWKYKYVPISPPRPNIFTILPDVEMWRCGDVEMKIHSNFSFSSQHFHNTKNFFLFSHFHISTSSHLHINYVGRRGFEPLKSKDSGFTVRPIWPLWNLPNFYRSHLSESNQRPTDYKSVALPAELKWLIAIPTFSQFMADMAIKNYPHFLGRQR